jgi:G3E family GTPase
VTKEELAEVRARIRAINPYARIHEAVKANVPLDAVLGKNAFDLDRILEIEPAFLADDEHGHGLKHFHDDHMKSLALEIDGDVNPEKFLPWINDLTQKHGPSILRSKGILSFPGEPKRFVYQGVHMILDGDLQRDWKPGEKRDSKIVFIGRDLPEQEIRDGFMACKA